MKHMLTSLAILCVTVLALGCSRDVRTERTEETVDAKAPVRGSTSVTPGSEPAINSPTTGPGTTSGTTTSRPDFNPGLGSLPPPSSPTENPEADMKQPAE